MVPRKNIGKIVKGLALWASNHCYLHAYMQKCCHPDMAVSALFRRIQLKNHSTVKEKKMKKVLQPLLVGSMFVVSFLGANAAFGQKTNTDPASRPQPQGTVATAFTVRGS